MKAMKLATGVTAWLLLSLTAPAHYAHIVLDGNFADWDGVPVIGTDSEDNATGIDLATLQVANDETNVYLRYTLHAAIDPNQTGGGTYLAVDEDNNTATGFDIFGQGLVGSEAGWQNDSPFEQATGNFNTGNGLTDATYAALPYATITTSVEVRISRAASHTVGGTPVFPADGATVRLYVWTETASADLMGGAYTLSLLITEPAFAVSTVTNAAVLLFDSQENITYQLQYSSNLLSPDWTFSGYQVLGNGGPMYLYDPTGFSTQKAYRIYVP